MRLKEFVLTLRLETIMLFKLIFLRNRNFFKNGHHVFFKLPTRFTYLSF